MSGKKRLRETRKGTVINATSKRQESQLLLAVECVAQRLQATFPTLSFTWAKREYLTPLIETLKRRFPEVAFCTCHGSSFMMPDGGFLSIVDTNDTHYTILIAEKKNQGTNDLRAAEGKPRQAQGNAIERLGKNVIGLRTMFLHESIFPFVCFGDGCDFNEKLSILDRVKTISMFGELNEEHLHREGDHFNRGTYYFRVPEWTCDEMADRCYAIAEKSIYYYFSKYGKSIFETRHD